MSSLDWISVGEGSLIVAQVKPDGADAKFFRMPDGWVSPDYPGHVFQDADLTLRLALHRAARSAFRPLDDPDQREAALAFYNQTVKRLIDAEGPGRGTMQTQPRPCGLGQSLDGLVEIYRSDGTSVVHNVTVYCKAHIRDPYTANVKTSYHNSDGYWSEQASDRANAAVIDGIHYRIKPDTAKPGPGSGYDGQKFTVRFHDGREVTTRNLWYQGPIPPVWRDRLPDNAEFVKAGASA